MQISDENRGSNFGEGVDQICGWGTGYSCNTFDKTLISKIIIKYQNGFINCAFTDM